MMPNEKTIEINRIGMDGKGQLYFRAIYNNQAFLYNNKSRKKILNDIIQRAHFNEIFVIKADENSLEHEAPIFARELEEKIKQPKYQYLNLKIRGDSKDQEAQKKLDNANKKQADILNNSKIILQRLSIFPWSFISGAKPGYITKDNITNKKIVKKIKHIEHRLRSIQTFGASLFVVGIILLLTFGSLMAFGWPIIVGGALALAGAGLLGAASTCGLQSNLFKQMQEINRLSDEFLEPAINQWKPVRRSPPLHSKEAKPDVERPTPGVASERAPQNSSNNQNPSPTKKK